MCRGAPLPVRPYCRSVGQFWKVASFDHQNQSPITKAKPKGAKGKSKRERIEIEHWTFASFLTFLSHYPYNIRHRFIGEMRRRVGGTMRNKEESAMTRAVNAVFDFVRFAEFEILFFLFFFIAFLLFKDLVSLSLSLCSLQFLMFYNLVCFLDESD